jgi:outer membrane lipoprotein-sorting protein
MSVTFRPGQACRLLSIVLAVAVSPPVVVAQSKPDIADILKKVSETYANPKQYQFSIIATSRQLNRSGQMKVDTETSEYAVKRPNKLRMSASGGALVMGKDLGEMLVVVDGDNTWYYVPRIKQYTKYKGAPVHTDPHDDESETKPGAPSEFINHLEEMLFFRYRYFVKVANRAKLLREENIPFDGASVACYVIEIDTNSPPTQSRSNELYRWWVDKKRYLVLREDYEYKPAHPGEQPPISGSAVYSIARINEPIDENLFVFSPPADAKLVDNFE